MLDPPRALGKVRELSKAARRIFEREKLGVTVTKALLQLSLALVSLVWSGILGTIPICGFKSNGTLSQTR